LFRDLMSSSTVGRIGAAFQDEGFAPSSDCTYDDSSVRRTLTQQYLEAVDWTDINHIDRVLRVFERLITGLGIEAQYTRNFFNALRRDGYITDEDTGHIRHAGPQFAPASLNNLADPSAIRLQLARIQRAITDDPALAVGSAKELIESTAKVVLTERGKTISDRADLPELVRDAQQALGLHPSSAAPGPDGGDAVKKVLGSVSGIAIGLAELRNRGYGTGPVRQPAQSASEHDTPTSPSTPPSPGASSCLTPSPTPKPLGANLPPELRRPPWPSPL
jgi:hypothetical protein